MAESRGDAFRSGGADPFFTGVAPSSMEQAQGLRAGSVVTPNEPSPKKTPGANAGEFSRIGDVREHPETGYRQVLRQGRRGASWVNEDEDLTSEGNVGKVLVNGFAKHPSELSSEETANVKARVAAENSSGRKKSDTKKSAALAGEITDSPEKMDREAGRAARAYIRDRVGAARAKLFGSQDEEAAPVTPVTGTKDVIGLIRNLHQRVDSHLNNIQSIAEAEAQHFDQKAAESQGSASDVLSEHAGNIRAALQDHVRNLRTVRGGRTRMFDPAGRQVETAALLGGAEKSVAGSATAVGNLNVASAGRNLKKTVTEIAKSGLGRLGVLPDVSHHELNTILASTGALPKAGEPDYSSIVDFHEVHGPSKPGFAWIGSEASRDPRLRTRQVPIHPDTLKEILDTPRNGRPRTKQDADYQKIAGLIADAKKAAGGSGEGVFKGREALGLPVESQVVPSTTDVDGKSGPTPVKRIPRDQQVGVGGKRALEAGKTTGVEPIPGYRVRPTRGQRPQDEPLTEEQRQTANENRIKTHIKSGKIVEGKQPVADALRRLISTVTPERLAELHEEVRNG